MARHIEKCGTFRPLTLSVILTALQSTFVARYKSAIRNVHGKNLPPITEIHVTDDQWQDLMRSTDPEAQRVVARGRYLGIPIKWTRAPELTVIWRD